MRVLVAPDAFKGTLSAPEAAQAMARGISRACPAAEIVLLPLADGGEGTLDAILAALPGERCQVRVPDAAGRPITAEYARLADGSAVIEAARVVGLTLPGVAQLPLLQRSSYGLGELLRHALDAGCRRLLVGLGGTATNDGGAGLLQALGVCLLAADGCTLPATPEGLLQLARMDSAGLDVRLAGCQIEILSDVDNPLCGEQGATCVFGPQKGLQRADAAPLDAALARYAALLDGDELARCPGSGAAGGLGFALQWLGARYCSGAERVLDLLGFDALLATADWVLTGEGSSDAQTLHGKAPWAVARHARQAGVPVTLLSGRIELQARDALSARFDMLCAVAEGEAQVAMALRDPAASLAAAAERAVRMRVK